MAKIIDGKQIAQEIKDELKEKIKELKSSGCVPGLTVVIVGEDPVYYTGGAADVVLQRFGRL